MDRGIHDVSNKLNFKIEVNKWYNLVFMVDQINHKEITYINGNKLNEVTDSAIVTDLRVGIPHLRLFSLDHKCRGSVFDAYNVNFKGKIDNFEVFNKILSDCEVKAIYDYSNNVTI